jgi:predicted dehydrogenase
LTQPGKSVALRWGILGCGNIARTVAAAITAVDGCELRAVASRSAAKAEAFAREASAPRFFADYAALVSCADIDVVYIATPPSRHLEDCLLCLDAGKHVLCEKPFAMNAVEALCMAERARSRGLFLMEAMWTRFLPAIARLEELVHSGSIGTPQMLVAGGAFQPRSDPAYYLFRAELGGGVMRDAGIYLLHFAHWLLGNPDTVQANCRIGETGVDEHDGVVLGFAGGALAMLHVSMRAAQPPHLELLGSSGRIRLQPPLFNPGVVELTRYHGAGESWRFAADASGYRRQIVEVRDCLEKGARESSRMPLALSIAVMETLQRILPAG